MSKQPNTSVGPLFAAFRLIYGALPAGLEPWQIADFIIEALDDPGMIPNKIARECIFEITNGTIGWPNNETRIRVVLGAEEQARSVFPELASVDEVHMAQIEYLCNKALYNSEEGR